jgi:hypothetical protein
MLFVERKSKEPMQNSKAVDKSDMTL